MSELNHNQNTEFEPESQNTENLSGQNAQPGQFHNDQQYNGYPQYNNPQSNYAGQPNIPQQGYDNGGYHNGQPGYNSQQYYGQNTGYQDQQYYGQNTAYDNQPYYGQNQGYHNQPYYGQNQNYNNQQYYGQNQGYNNQQYYGQNAGYNNQQYYGPGYGQQPYANPQSAYRPTPAAPEPVSNVFYYILMALTAISALIAILAARGLITNMFTSVDFNSVAGQDFASMYSSMMNSFANAPGYSAYSVLNSLLGFAILAVSIIDIVHVHKKGYPILGLILFTILCKPGYFIWRAYVLKQKKTVPVLFTVAYVLLYFIYFIWCFSFMMSLMA